MLVQERDQRNRDFRERNREARKREGQNPRGERQSLAEVCVCFRAPPRRRRSGEIGDRDLVEGVEIQRE